MHNEWEKGSCFLVKLYCISCRSGNENNRNSTRIPTKTVKLFSENYQLDENSFEFVFNSRRRNGIEK